MGFSSFDDMISEMTQATPKTQPIVFQKTVANGAASAAGRWHEMFTATGIPAAGSFSGAAGTGTILHTSTAGALIPCANVSTDTRHVTYAGIVTPTATVVPATMVLCDFLVYWPALVVTGTPTTLVAQALDRYTDGVGVQAIVAVQAVLGAASPALTFTYTGSVNGGSQVASAHTSPVNSAPVSTLFQSNNGSPFLRLTAGDTGVKSVQSYTLAAGTTGTVSLMLVKPLLEVPVPAINILGEREFTFQVPSLPRVYDTACLGWILNVGGALVTTSSITGFLNTAWG